MTKQENLLGNLPAPASPATAKRKRGIIRRAFAVFGWGSSATAAGYLLHGPVAAVVVGLAAVVLAACAIAVLRPVLFDGRDPRSPFVRFMLLVCVLTGRLPADYLPPADDD